MHNSTAENLRGWRFGVFGVTLRGLKDQLNEFNQGVNPRDTRRVEYVRYKRPTLNEGRVSFTWVELTNDENVKSMFWEHNMF